MTDLCRHARRARALLAAALGALLSFGAPASALAQATYTGSSVPLNQLQPRGTVQASDLLPDQPNGVGNLESIYVSDLANYIQNQPSAPPVYVSALPACNSALEGVRAAVKDALSPSYGAPVYGSGTVHIGVGCNGTAWIAGY